MLATSIVFVAPALSLALVGTGLLPAFGDKRLRQLHAFLVAAVAAFPIVTLAYVMNAVVLRYYLD
jgi:nitrate reductase NapE component